MARMTVRPHSFATAAFEKGKDHREEEGRYPEQEGYDAAGVVRWFVSVAHASIIANVQRVGMPSY